VIKKPGLPLEKSLKAYLGAAVLLTSRRRTHKLFVQTTCPD